MDSRIKAFCVTPYRNLNEREEVEDFVNQTKNLETYETSDFVNIVQGTEPWQW